MASILTTEQQNIIHFVVYSNIHVIYYLSGVRIRHL